MFIVKMTARAERETIIIKGVASSTENLEFYEFRNEKYLLPIIRIDVNVPIYRMENFRTFTAQNEYIAEHNLDPDFFLAGQEVESCQQVQHEILEALARKGKADSVIPVIEVLAKEKQREPILISSSGVVINGNRRLAGMRALLQEDSSACPEFSHVNCMVLPKDATTEEILEIEAGLQAKPETKLEYDWIGDAQLIHKLQMMGRTTDQIAQKLNRKKSEIENSLQALMEAELYLKDWVGEPKAYTRIKDDAEQLFKDLPKRLDGKEQNLQDASRVIAWTLFENRDKLNGRVYNYNSAFGKLASDVLDRVTDVLELEGTPEEGDAGGGFDIDIDVGVSPNNYDTLISTLKDGGMKDEAVDALIDACDSAIEREKGLRSGESALKAVTAAHSKMSGVDLTTALTKTHKAIRKQLESIIRLSNALLSKLDNYEKIDDSSDK